jgi:hypothetical protein
MGNGIVEEAAFIDIRDFAPTPEDLGFSVGWCYLPAGHAVSVDLVTPEISQELTLTCTDTPSGGNRWWFQCDGCKSRAEFLYRPVLARLYRCRRCHRLVHGSAQRHDARVDRLRRNPRALRRALKTMLRHGDTVSGCLALRAHSDLIVRTGKRPSWVQDWRDLLMLSLCLSAAVRGAVRGRVSCLLALAAVQAAERAYPAASGWSGEDLPARTACRLRVATARHLKRRPRKRRSTSKHLERAVA